MDEQRQDDQQEPIYNSSMLIHNIVLKIFRVWWTIETGVGKWSGRSVLTARHDEYRQVPAAVELFGDRIARMRPSLSNLSQNAEEVLRWSREEVGQYSSLSLSLYSSLTHNRNINPLENKLWEIHIFINKCVSFVIIFDYVSANICICIMAIQQIYIYIYIYIGGVSVCVYVYPTSPLRVDLT